jgi:hypothetical protein
VVDLSSYEHDGDFAIVREGAVPRALVEESLRGGFRDRWYGGRR